MRCAYLNIASGAPSSGALGGSTGGTALLPATWGLPQDARQIGRLVYGSRMLLQQPPTSNENRWARVSAGAAPRVSLVVLEACRERFCKLPPLATGGGDSHRGWLAAGCCCCQENPSSDLREPSECDATCGGGAPFSDKMCFTPFEPTLLSPARAPLCVCERLIALCARDDKTTCLCAGMDALTGRARNSCATVKSCLFVARQIYKCV